MGRAGGDDPEVPRRACFEDRVDIGGLAGGEAEAVHLGPRPE